MDITSLATSPGTAEASLDGQESAEGFTASGLHAREDTSLRRRLLQQCGARVSTILKNPFIRIV